VDARYLIVAGPPGLQDRVATGRVADPALTHPGLRVGLVMLAGLCTRHVRVPEVLQVLEGVPDSVLRDQVLAHVLVLVLLGPAERRARVG
jgi:hypothetical protein